MDGERIYDKLKLWKVEIPDYRDDQLSNLSLQDNDEFLSKYFTADLPAEETFHVIVEPPASTATSNEVLKLREEVALLKEKLSKSEYVRNEGFKWTSAK
ncbi:hypothetical protein GLOIN_2v811958 [Rhizophagus irregularis DAOM 181602=DAOM 197198]|nr:hypothetical protein GLOIN_2v811958 [Rhizophagus irregularis DAOM 181602=DAOM 197198]